MIFTFGGLFEFGEGSAPFSSSWSTAWAGSSASVISITVKNQTVRWIVWRNTDRNLIAENHANAEFTQLSRQARSQSLAGFRFDPEITIGKDFNNRTFKLY